MVVDNVVQFSLKSLQDKRMGSFAIQFPRPGITQLPQFAFRTFKFWWMKSIRNRRDIFNPRYHSRGVINNNFLCRRFTKIRKLFKHFVGRLQI